MTDSQIPIEEVEEEIRRIDLQIEALQMQKESLSNYLAARRGSLIKLAKLNQISLDLNDNNGRTDAAPTRRKVIEHAVEYLREKKRFVSTGELLEYLQGKGIDWEGVKNVDSYLSTILSEEHRKKGQIKRVRIGLWKLNQPIQVNPQKPVEIEKKPRLSKPSTTNGQQTNVVETLVELYGQHHRPISIQELTDALEKKHYKFATWGTRVAVVASAMSKALKRSTSPRIERVGEANYRPILETGGVQRN